MKLKKVIPISNSNRHTLKIEKNLLCKNNKIVKSIIKTNKTKNGRSSVNGRITVWHKERGAKKLYRDVHFSKQNENKNFLVIANCYDPNRTSFINLNFELTKKKFFFNTASDSVVPGSLIKNAKNINEVKLGFRTTIKNIPAGSLIHNLTLNNSSKTKYIRSAGTFGQIVQSGETTAKIKLPSKKIIEIAIDNLATVGVISNSQHNLTILGKAGTSRNLGKRPTVRGIAMNPVDHPHGGRGNKGMIPVTPWGKPTKSGYYLKKKKKIYDAI